MKGRRFFILIFLFIHVITACRKGADDPLVSLASRKARFTGDWVLKEGTLVCTNAGVTTTFTYTDSRKIKTDGPSTSTTDYSQNVNIYKDGSYKIEINDDGKSETEEGVWFFGRKNKELDLKNKECVIFRETNYAFSFNGSTSTETYEGTSCPTRTWKIGRLANKELIIIFDGSSTISSYSSILGSMTFIQ